MWKRSWKKNYFREGFFAYMEVISEVYLLEKLFTFFQGSEVYFHCILFYFHGSILNYVETFIHGSKPYLIQ